MPQISISASINGGETSPASISLSGELPEEDVQEVWDLIKELTIKITSPANQGGAE